MHRLRVLKEVTSYPHVFWKDREYNVEMLDQYPHKSVKTDVLGDCFYFCKYDGDIVFFPKNYVHIVSNKVKKKHWINNLTE